MEDWIKSLHTGVDEAALYSTLQRLGESNKAWKLALEYLSTTTMNPNQLALVRNNLRYEAETKGKGEWKVKRDAKRKRIALLKEKKATLQFRLEELEANDTEEEIKDLMTIMHESQIKSNITRSQFKDVRSRFQSCQHLKTTSQNKINEFDELVYTTIENKPVYADKSDSSLVVNNAFEKITDELLLNMKHTNNDDLVSELKQHHELLYGTRMISPNDILRNTKNIAAMAVTNVRQMVNAIDAQRTKRMLALQFMKVQTSSEDKGSWQDRSTPTQETNERLMKELFEKKQQEHIERFFKAEKMRNNAYETRMLHEQQMEELLIQAKQRNGPNADIVYTLSQCEIELEGVLTQVHLANIFLASAEETKNKLNMDKKELEEKLSILSGFVEKKETNDDIIISLMEENKKWKNLIQNTHRQIQTHEESILAIQIKKIQEKQNNMYNNIITELKLTSQDQYKHTNDFDIYTRIKRDLPIGSPKNNILLHEFLINYVNEMKKKEKTITQARQSITNICQQSMVENIDDSLIDVLDMTRMNSISEEFTSQIINHSKEIENSLEEVARINSCIVQFHQRTKGALHDWFEQPAMKTVPWVTRDGMTADEWVTHKQNQYKQQQQPRKQLAERDGNIDMNRIINNNMKPSFVR